MTTRITFLGASGTVTGSKYLVEVGQYRILVDAGMFQGDRRWREENWAEPQCDLSKIDAVLLTHAHIDHTGILPRYVALGLKAPVYCSAQTAALSQLLLLDSGRLQEEEAQYREETGRSRHKPPKPLYTENDAKEALKLFKSVEFHKPVELFPNVTATWSRMGHILGAGSINLKCKDKMITFSGDIGRYSVPILKDPEPVELGDLLLVESTYGDRLHSNIDQKDLLEQILNETVQRGGVLVIPSFAVGRTQSILYYLRELKEAKRIPDIPVIVDSPMASDATELYAASPDDYDEAALGIVNRGGHPFTCSKLTFVRDRDESIALNKIQSPMVLISASGMLTGGRILHHLKHRIADPRNTILFVGHQPPQGRGDWIKSGAKSLTLLGDQIPIRAEIKEISGLSAHGDRDELLRWCKSCTGSPSKVMVVHGEPDVAKIFAATLREKLEWNVEVAEYKGEIVLS